MLPLHYYQFSVISTNLCFMAPFFWTPRSNMTGQEHLASASCQSKREIHGRQPDGATRFECYGTVETRSRDGVFRSLSYLTFWRFSKVDEVRPITAKAKLLRREPSPSEFPLLV